MGVVWVEEAKCDERSVELAALSHSRLPLLTERLAVWFDNVDREGGCSGADREHSTSYLPRSAEKC
jgi:hypothetical protein